MSSIEVIPPECLTKADENSGSSKNDSKDIDDEVSGEIIQDNLKQQPKQQQIIRYSTATLFSLRSSKLSQQKPAIINMDLACMAHHKPPPKTLIANMMPKFALNYQMPNRGEESISPLSFHSNSSSSSNLSYQKQRYQDANNSGDGYSNSRYYYNKYKNHDDGNNSGSGSSRIIYKTTGANASNGNSIRFLKKAYNSKYEEQESSLGLISNKNILDNASRVITAADHRNSRKKMSEDDVVGQNDDKLLNIKTNNNEEKVKQSPTDEANNNTKNDKESTRKLTEINANDLMMRNDLKNLPDKLDITNHIDDIFKDLNINQLLDEKISDERESSRFSKWFNISKEDAKDEKLPDTQNNNKNDENLIAATSVLFQSQENEKYFQPIKDFELQKGQDMQRNDPLSNILQHQSLHQQVKSQVSPNNSGQVHSVEELEAKLRQHRLNQQEEQERKNNENEKKVLQNFFQQQLMPSLMQQQQSPNQPQAQHVNQQNQEDINAFKKLLSQITNDENKVPSQLMSNKNLQHNSDMMMQFQKGGFPINNKIIPNAKIMNPHMMPQSFNAAGNTNLEMKFLQQQKIAMPEIIKRPEVQALVQELTSGEISQYNLWQRLTAPGLTPIEREIITCALNIFNTNSNNGNTGIFSKQQQPVANNIFPQAGPLNTNQNANATQAALHQLLQQQQQMKTNLAAPIPIPPQASPLSPVPPLDQHLLFQHQAAVAANKQLRLSPLPAGMPQRIPSPRELQYHTQSIMQNALIRKKLEEQRENFRKRQEQEKQESAKKNQSELTPTSVTASSVGDSNDQSNTQITTTAPSQAQDDSLKNLQADNSPAKKSVIAQHQNQIQRQHAPSPSIFTPTSVLRKMTAEKENPDGLKISNRIDDNKKKSVTGILPHNNPIRNQQLPPQPFLNNIGSMSQIDARMKMQNDGGVFGMNAWDSQQQQQMKPPGRPIVKSSAVSQNSMMQQNSIGNMMPSMNFDFQQQQQMQKMNQMQKAQFLQQQQMIQMKKQQMDNNPVLSQFMAQQQQRAQSQFRTQFQQQQPISFPPSMMQGRSSDKSDEMENRNMVNNGGCLSPTSNQLAKWFSPELLADASAGKLLPSLNVGQMMSLEELEKCMQNS
ncbi:hypothetical protein PVAND_003669 [Polypedilum vanderplanki]|uniref:Uncharacterized protein n=1 Tax=Polypedilum vanderplanki TaxID=319348 RepID=A0A9J6BVA6_POLVA|nr:hypothetical protein PVAND_003669 [Polypedilum vanderplanki]